MPQRGASPARPGYDPFELKGLMTFSPGHEAPGTLPPGGPVRAPTRPVMSLAGVRLLVGRDETLVILDGLPWSAASQATQHMTTLCSILNSYSGQLTDRELLALRSPLFLFCHHPLT